MTEIKLYKSPWRALKILALVLPLIAGSVWMITNEDFGLPEKVIAWFCTCFFSLGIPVGLFHLFDRRPQIIINQTGIFDRTVHKELINWRIILDAYLFEVHGQKFISLVVDEKFKSSGKKGKFYNSMVRLSESLGAQELNIQVSQINIDETRLTEFIIAMTKADESEKEKLIKALPTKA